jgi:carotenoid cleavage dioxygenase-like enzyme
LERETSVAALNVEGRIPDWLTGTLLRMGPARFEWGPDRYRHWFDGSGMIHKFSFTAGKVGYTNRYVRGTAFVENERAGRITAQTDAQSFEQVGRAFAPHVIPLGFQWGI